MRKQNIESAGAIGIRICTLPQAAAAFLGYAVLAGYLYYPHQEQIRNIDYIHGFNAVIAALGCFVLSRRWISSPAGSFFAGAIYGFGPFSMSLWAYHPAAGFGLAAFGWLFCPSAFVRFKEQKSLVSDIASAGLAVMPFVAVGVIYWLLALRWIGPYYPIPNSARLEIDHMLGLVGPLAQKVHGFALGFYHVPTIVCLMGTMIYVTVFRVKVTILVIIGILLAFANPIIDVSPVVWASVPMLCFSILVGLGMQAAAWAGRTDAKWLLVCGLAAAGLCAAGFLLGATAAPEKVWAYVQAGRMYGLAAVMMGCIYFAARAGVRWHGLRWLVLSAGVGIDIVMGARYLTDKIF